MFDDNFDPKAEYMQNVSRLRHDAAYKYLNQQQFEAATYPLKSFVVLAGAGSGKTSVLIKRLRYLITEQEVKGNEIMAVTFTKKAAGEMKMRAYNELAPLGKQLEADNITIGTFHSICLKMMKNYQSYLPINVRDSQILDSDDREDLLLRLMSIGYPAIEEYPANYVSINQTMANLKRTFENYFEPKKSDIARNEPESYPKYSALLENLVLFEKLTKGDKKTHKKNENEIIYITKGILSNIDDFKENGFRDSDLRASPQMARFIERMTIDGVEYPKILTEILSISEIQMYLAILYYREYEAYLLDNNLLDFSDLLVSMVEVFRNHPEAREKARQQYRCIMVDEFQDTNKLQYEWLRLISGEKTSLMIVGDDDQSIYAFRGSNPHYLNYFRYDFQFPLLSPDEESTETTYHRQEQEKEKLPMIKLEQNYRSTYHILSLANNIIAANENRNDKTLFTKKDKSKALKVKAISHTNTATQAQWVALDILDQMERSKQEVEQGLREKALNWNDFAVLYRNNACQFEVDKAMVAHNIPYVVYGGFNFFKRKEIKEHLTWIRFLTNMNVDMYFDSVIKQIPLSKRPNPEAYARGDKKKGFEPQMIDAIRDECRLTGVNSFEALCNIATRFNDEVNNGKVSPLAIYKNGENGEFINDREKMKIGQSCQDFVEFLIYVHSGVQNANNLAEAVRIVVERCKNIEYYRNELALLKAKERKDNSESVKKTTSATKIAEYERYIINVEELIKNAESEYLSNKQYYDEMKIGEQLKDWLRELELLTDKENANRTDRVSMMTTHAAKGLEFSRVYLIDVNEGIFPSFMALRDGTIEEERRLFYVAITRAKEELVISSSSTISQFVDSALYHVDDLEDIGVYTGYMVENIGQEPLRKPSEINRKDFWTFKEADGKVIKARRENLDQTNKDKATIFVEPNKINTNSNKRERWGGTGTKSWSTRTFGNGSFKSW